MSELERRLRDALHGAAESAPDGLLDRVVRRHRRHQLRLGASLVAVVAAAAIAVPSVAGALRSGGTGGHGPGPSAGHSFRTTGPATGAHRHAVPGTALAGCPDSNVGKLGRDWKSPAATHVGPVWVLPESVAGGSRVSARRGKNAVRLYVAIVVLNGLRPGSIAVVESAYPRNLRFLDSKHDSLSPGIQYSMSSGESGVTFVSCARSLQTFPAPYTDYLGAYLVRGKRCVPVSVLVSGWSHPRELRLGDCRKH